MDRKSDSCIDERGWFCNNVTCANNQRFFSTAPGRKSNVKNIVTKRKKPCQLRRRRSNSCSSIFLKDTIAFPNKKCLLEVVTYVLDYMIKNPPSKGVFLSAFELSKNQKLILESNGINLKQNPTKSDIIYFIENIFSKALCETESLIIMLVYLDRLKSISNQVVSKNNWMNIFSAAILTASKVYDDCAMKNSDFAKITPYSIFSLKSLNQLEIEFLKKIKYNVLVSPQEYAACFFQIRSVYFKASKREKLPKEEIDKKLASKLKLFGEKIETDSSRWTSLLEKYEFEGSKKKKWRLSII